jgi:hypothetical protein
MMRSPHGHDGSGAAALEAAAGIRKTETCAHDNAPSHLAAGAIGFGKDAEFMSRGLDPAGSRKAGTGRSNLLLHRQLGKHPPETAA